MSNWCQNRALFGVKQPAHAVGNARNIVLLRVGVGVLRHARVTVRGLHQAKGAARGGAQRAAAGVEEYGGAECGFTVGKTVPPRCEGQKNK